MKTLLATTCLLTGLFGGATLAQAADCGTLTIASMNWQSSEVLAAVDKIILEEGYDCNVEVVSGDTVPTITSMAEKGQPDIASEAWIDVLPDIVKRGVDEKKLVIAATVLPDGGINGWWIPKYLAEANPEIRTIQDALKHPELFPHPEDASKGAIYNAPQGWGGAIVTAQLFKAYEAEKAGFELVDPGSPGALDASIARAYENKAAWLGFYWAPTALLGKYEMVKLDWGVPLDEAEWKRCVTVLDCPDPKPSAWPVDHVVTLVSTKFADGADPAVMDYLNKRGWSNDTVGKLMAWMTDNQATGEDGAWHFLEEQKDVWTQWVTPEAAEKIEAAM